MSCILPVIQLHQTLSFLGRLFAQGELTPIKQKCHHSYYLETDEFTYSHLSPASKPASTANVRTPMATSRGMKPS